MSLSQIKTVFLSGPTPTISAPYHLFIVISTIMAVEPNAATADTAAGADARNTTSTLSSPLTDSSVNTNEPRKEPSPNDGSFTSGDDHPATADTQCNEEDDAHADEEGGLARNLDDGTGASQYPRDSASEDGVNNGAYSKELTIGASELMQELQMLREKVSKIEKRTKKRPDYPILEAEWRTAREELGIDDEKEFWERFVNRRKEIAGTLVKRDFDHPYTLDLNDLAREMDADPVYASDVLRWRKNWERRLVSSKMWVRGDERWGAILDLEAERIPSIRREDEGEIDLEDSDTDGSLDFELNLDKLRHRYLRKVDRLHEERDVRRVQSLVEARKREREREREREKLAKQLLEAKSGQEASGGEAPRAASVDSQHAEDTADELMQPDNAFLKLNYVDWIGFDALRDVPEKESFVIDVLIGEPEINFGFSRRANRGRNAKRDDRKQNIRREVSIDTKQPTALTGQSPLPERIRIHSTQLIRILEKVHGESVGSEGPLIIIRPFRALIHYDKALRRWHWKLEKKFGITEAPTSGSEGMSKVPYARLPMLIY